MGIDSLKILISLICIIMFIILLALHSNGYTIANIANHVCTLRHINNVN